MLVAVTVSLLTTLNPMGMHTFRELQVQRLWGTGGRSEALVRNDSLKGQAFGEYAASFPVDSYHGCRVDFLLRPCRRQVTISCAWFLMLQILLDLSGILESSFSCTRWWCKRRPGPWGVSGEYSQFASCQAEGYQEMSKLLWWVPCSSFRVLLSVFEVKEMCDVLQQLGRRSFGANFSLLWKRMEHLLVELGSGYDSLELHVRNRGLSFTSQTETPVWRNVCKELVLRGRGSWWRVLLGPART